ncbi:hypothetical protein DL765_010996 [Monosporascus sp. GIB2]|nr:hypothetical protein DL765_010996 [Monosporascus sp. GIB2]
MGAEAAIAAEGEGRSLYDDGSNWTALYVLVLLVPFVAVASMLYSNWSDRRPQSPKAKPGGGAAEDVESAAAVRAVYQRNHWFPWREASEDRRGRGRERAPPAPKPAPQAPQAQARTAVVPATFASSGGGPVRDAPRSMPVPMAMPSAHPSRPEEETRSRPADPYDDNGAYGYGGRNGNGYGSEEAVAGRGRRDFQNVPF